MKNTIIAGTYTEKGSEGIYRFEMENGVLSEARLFAAIPDPKYVCPAGKLIASVCSFAEGAGCALFDQEGNMVSHAVFEKTPSCYITFAEGRIWCANYHEGHFNVLSVKDGQLCHERTVAIREKAGCHQVMVNNGRVLVPCLLIDKVMIYDLDLDPVYEIVFPEGTGPRHGVFTADGSRLYLVSELSNELFEIDPENWQVLRSVSVLENGARFLKDSAAIRLSEDEKTVYVSTRTLNIISVIDRGSMKLIQVIGCGGDHPRDILRVGDHLLAANRLTNNIVSYRLNEDGTVGEKEGETTVIQAISLIVMP